jgi:hypothetical protein
VNPAWSLLLAGWLGLGCTSRPTSSPFTAAEIDRALAPTRTLRARCYLGSAAARAARPAVFEVTLQVEASGRVRAVPTFASPEEPALIECVRRALDDLRFPARGRDRLQLHFELRSALAPTPLASPGPV